jgi:hypothetical protein
VSDRAEFLGGPMDGKSLPADGVTAHARIYVPQLFCENGERCGCHKPTAAIYEVDASAGGVRLRYQVAALVWDRVYTTPRRTRVCAECADRAEADLDRRASIADTVWRYVMTAGLRIERYDQGGA